MVRLDVSPPAGIQEIADRVRKIANHHGGRDNTGGLIVCGSGIRCGFGCCCASGARR
jgi:hypothetical protein